MPVSHVDLGLNINMNATVVVVVGEHVDKAMSRSSRVSTLEFLALTCSKPTSTSSRHASQRRRASTSMLKVAFKFMFRSDWDRA
jgi:hypothetical protein